MPVCRRLRRWHGATFQSSVGIPVMLGLLEFSDWQLVQPRYPQLVPVPGKMLCPFHCALSDHSGNNFFGTIASFSWYLDLFLPHRTPSRWCVERMRGLHISNLHGNDLLLVTICTNSRPNAVFLSPWSPGWKGAQHYTKKLIRAKHRHNILISKRKKLYCLTNLASSISSVKSLMVVRLGMFLTIHVSGVIEIGITDQINWMHDSAGADVIFVVSWPLRVRVFNFFCFLCCCVPTNIEFAQERSLRVFRKKTSFSLCVHKCFAPGWQEGLCAPSMRVVKSGWTPTSRNFCLHSCDQIVRLGWSFRAAVYQAILVWNVRKIMNTSGTGSLSQHSNHVDGLLLFR